MTAIYLIAGIVALVWGVVFVRRGSVLGGCLAYLVVAMCFGHHFAHFAVGPLTLTFDRLVLALLIGTHLMQWRWGRIDPKPLGRADWLVMAFLGVLVFGGFYGGWHNSRPDQGGDGDPCSGWSPDI